MISGKRERRGNAVWVRNPIASLVEQGNQKTTTRKKGALDRWRRLIAARATLALPDGHILWAFPVVVQCVFVWPRKESHFKKSGGLKSTAPLIPGYDLDKYFRAVGDSLSKVVYEDDRQITNKGGTRKRFGNTKGSAGVHVKIWKDYECG